MSSPTPVTNFPAAVRRAGRTVVLLLLLGRVLVAAEPRRVPPGPPPPLPPRSALDLFRELAASTPERRERMLAGKSPEARALILRRLQEFESMSVEQRQQRQLRLRLAQLRYQLSFLLRAEPSQRAGLLDAAPEADRPLLEERIRAWDALPAAAQRDLLELDQSLHYFVRQPSADPQRLAEVLATVPTNARPVVQAQFQRWSALSPGERVDKTASFRRFFDLTADEQARVLGVLAEPDRRLMQRTLESFARLPADQRARCIDGFEKFARLGAAERDEFLRNASRWQAMTAEDRAAWRRLVYRTPPPPLPPVPSPPVATPSR